MFESRTISTRGLSEAIQALEKEKSVPPMTLAERALVYFEQLRLPVFRYLLRKTRDVGQAEDLTQETFLRLCRHLLEDRPLENPKAWLFTWPTIWPSTSLAATATRSTWTSGPGAKSRSRAAIQSDLEALGIQNERLDRLQMAVLNLTQLQRECLHLRAEGLRPIPAPNHANRNNADLRKVLQTVWKRSLSSTA